MEPPAFFRFRVELADLAELVLEPPAVVERSIHEIENGAAFRAAGMILLHAGLEADGLKELFAKIHNAGAQLRTYRLRDGTVE